MADARKAGRLKNEINSSKSTAAGGDALIPATTKIGITQPTVKAKTPEPEL